MKVRVTTEKKRVGAAESSLIQKNGPTEISHPGLDCEEEEEEGSTKVQRSLLLGSCWRSCIYLAKLSFKETPSQSRCSRGVLACVGQQHCSGLRLEVDRCEVNFTPAHPLTYWVQCVLPEEEDSTGCAFSALLLRTKPHLPGQLQVDCLPL